MDNVNPAEMTTNEYDEYVKTKIEEENAFLQQNKIQELLDSKKGHNPRMIFEKNKAKNQFTGSNITKAPRRRG